MSLNESIVEAAAIEWSWDPPALPRRNFGGQGRGDAVGHRASFTALRRAGPHLSPPDTRLAGRLVDWLAARSARQCKCGGVQSGVHPKNEGIIMFNAVSSSRSTRSSRRNSSSNTPSRMTTLMTMTWVGTMTTRTSTTTVVCCRPPPACRLPLLLPPSASPASPALMPI